MRECVCTIDLGTTWIKAGLYDGAGQALLKGSVPVPRIVLWEGFSTFDAAKYIDEACSVLRELTSRLAAESPELRILALVPTGQRSTVLGLNANGSPATPALCWHDVSVQTEVEAFCERFDPARYRAITGLPPLHVLSLFKLLGLRTRVPETAQTVSRFALLHDLLLARLGAEGYLCDPSNASAMGLLDLRKGEWHPALLEASGVDPEQLPRIVPAGTHAGAVSPQAAEQTGLPRGLPLIVGGGDQQCSTLVAGASAEERVAACLGTAGIVSRPVVAPMTSNQSGLYCLAHVIPGRAVLEGLVNSVGSSFEWITRVTALGSVEELDSLAAESAPGSNGVAYMPFIAGVGTPDYASALQGSFSGLAESHGRADMARAVVEGVACELRRVLDVFDPSQTATIVLSGNACRSRVFTQTLAAMCRGRLMVSPEADTSMLGAAMIGWVGLERFTSIDEASTAVSGRQLLRCTVEQGAEFPEALYTAHRDRVKTVLANRNEDDDGELVDDVNFPKSTRRKLNEMIRRSLDLAGVAFYCYRLDGTITFIDQASLQILDLAEAFQDPSALVGTNLSDLLSYVQPERSLRQHIHTEGEAHGLEYQFQTLSGKDRWTLHDSFMDQDPNTGEPIVHAMVRDITDRKLAETKTEESRERLRELGQRLSDIREQERGQLARDIHDDIGQCLYGLRLQLQSLSSALGANPEAVQQLAQVDATLSDTVARIRALVRGLRPPVLDDIGLPAAMQQELDAVGGLSGFRTSLRVDGDSEQISDTRLITGLFRLFQEAVTNAVRHSHGSRVDVILSIDARQIVLSIADDGEGLPEPRVASPESFGLQGMSERALAANGKIAFKPNRPSGTIVQVQIPLAMVIENGEARC